VPSTSLILDPVLISSKTFCEHLLAQNSKNGCSFYLVRHDWHDKDCVNIMKSVRAAMTNESRLLICES